ncbi:hypothetical protein BDR03DRAFT_964233 [Suillus americanus]|nr:hypothetical protein BDR03DRAFT_964233 [Suillus americanus]
MAITKFKAVVIRVKSLIRPVANDRVSPCRNNHSTKLPIIHHISKRLFDLSTSYHLGQTMRFSFLAVIVALAASIMFVRALETPYCPEDGGSLSRDTLAECLFYYQREYCLDAIKRAGRFAPRGAVIGLYQPSEGGSRSSDGVGNKRSERRQ